MMTLLTIQIIQQLKKIRILLKQKADAKINKIRIIQKRKLGNETEAEVFICWERDKQLDP